MDKGIPPDDPTTNKEYGSPEGNPTFKELILLLFIASPIIFSVLYLIYGIIVNQVL